MGPARQNPIQRTVSLFICVCIALCTIIAHNIAQNRPDSFPPYPPDDHHSSDDVYLREGGCVCANWTAFSDSLALWIMLNIYCVILAACKVTPCILYGGISYSYLRKQLDCATRARAVAMS